MSEEGGSDGLPLSGLRVLDFTWGMVGPTSTRYLADYGATVVRVETSRRLDPSRAAHPYMGGRPGPERAGLAISSNANKYGITLDLQHPKGRELFLRLVAWADVLVASFSPPALRRLGLTYQELRQHNPSLVMVTTSINGGWGPQADFSGFGFIAAAKAGFPALGGWPDRDPPLFGAYTDYMTPRYIVAALLAALDYRRRSGQGQHIDVAQVEAAVQFLAPAVLDYSAHGRLWPRAGNRAPDAVPHGVFPCQGEDRWVAIAVHDDGQWRAFCQASGHPQWLEDPRFATFLARKRHEALLEELVADWTSRHSAEEVEGRLQAAGVPASIVWRIVECAQEPQLRAWGHFQEAEHAQLGQVVLEGCRFHLSRTPARLRWAGPLLGQHNQLVLSQFLGLTEEEIAELAACGALE
jgi:crotonobetainyl-CoA:carnitine CoA-transferase CaiB-like acyl-CoA transferase